MNLSFDFTLSPTDDPEVFDIGGTFTGELGFSGEWVDGASGVAVDVELFGEPDPDDGEPRSTWLAFRGRDRRAALRSLVDYLMDLRAGEEFDLLDTDAHYEEDAA